MSNRRKLKNSPPTVRLPQAVLEPEHSAMMAAAASDLLEHLGVRMTPWQRHYLESTFAAAAGGRVGRLRPGRHAAETREKPHPEVLRALYVASLETPCCPAVTNGDIFACSCWSPIHDQGQATDLNLDEIPVPMDRPCGDCAYRKGSPERQGETHVRGDEHFLNGLVERGETFWCHDGFAQVVAYEHDPTGFRIQVPPNVAYAPPIVDGTPYRADGRPGAICAGWTARRLAHVQRGVGQ